MTDVVTPKSLAASSRPVLASALKLLSFSTQTSDTRPLISEHPVRPLSAPKLVENMTVKMNANVRRRFMGLVRPPQLGGRRTHRPAGAMIGKLSREHAPEHVREEYDVQAPSEHERRKRQGVLFRARAQLIPDERA